MELDGKIAEFEESKPYRVVPKLDPKKTHYFLIGEAAATDPSWGPIIGDIAANLRDILDNLVYAYAVDNVRRVSGETAFPIVDHASELKGRAYQAAIGDLPLAYQTLVTELQPCNGSKGDLMRARALTCLRVMSNRHKHRHGHPTVLAQDHTKRTGITVTPVRDVIFLRSGPPERLATRGPVDGAKIAKVPVRVTGEDPEVHVDEHLEVCVAFGNRVQTLKGEPVRPVFTAIFIAVLQIVGLFITVKP